MNILVFSTVFYPAVGGIENQTLLLIEQFIKCGHRVKVITYQDSQAELKDIEICYAPNYLKFIKFYLWCDVFYMPNISLKGIWLPLFNINKKWIISHNDFSFEEKRGRLVMCKSIRTRVKNFLFRLATRNISVSESIAARLPAESTVVHNCYDDSVFRIYADVERKYDFVFLGRLVTQKGCDLFLRACERLPKPFSVGIIGIGPEMERLQGLVKESGLTDYVRFWGLLKGRELARVLNQYNHMVIPSVLAEGFGMVSLEGMACGCNVIAANAAGLADAVGQHGQLFEMGNQEALSELLARALVLPEANEIEQDKRMNYLRMHSRTAVARRYLDIFEYSDYSIPAQASRSYNPDNYPYV